MVTEDESWNFNLFRIWLPEEIIDRITSIQSPNPSTGLDRVAWAGASSGSLSIKSAYRVVKEDTWNSKDELWKLSWKFQGTQRVCLFIWLALK